MRLGVLLPHRAVVLQSARRPPLEVCWTVARMCDEAGLDLWVGDSVVAKPRLEPLTTLAYLAAMTQRARLGTAVLLPALRQPTVLAQALANIDQLSHGRLVLGLGVGWGLPEIAREWEACGRVHKRRRQDLEEHIVVCRTLRARCEEALVQHRRSLPDFPMCVYTTVRLDADVTQAEMLTRAFLEQYYGGGIHYRGLMGLGPASLVSDTLKRYEAAGVTDLCIRLVGTDQVSQLEQFIHEVAPAFTTLA